MKNRIISLVTAFVSMFSFQAQAQSFLDRMFAPDSVILDFPARHIAADAMTENDPSATYSFEFTNRSFWKVKMERVVSTCSCIYAYCDKEEVKPGEKAVITVRFNPKGQAGKSEKSIYVYTGNGNDPAAILTLSTDVKSVMDVSGRYPISMGAIKLSRSVVRFKRGHAATETVRFVNVSGGSLKFDCDRALLPQCLRFYAEPVRPLKEGVIKISYDPSKDEGKDDMIVLLQGLGLDLGKASIKVIME